MEVVQIILSPGAQENQAMLKTLKIVVFTRIASTLGKLMIKWVIISVVENYLSFVAGRHVSHRRINSLELHLLLGMQTPDQSRVSLNPQILARNHSLYKDW